MFVVAFCYLANAPNGKGKTRGILRQRYEMCCRLFSLAIVKRDGVSDSALMFTPSPPPPPPQTHKKKKKNITPSFFN